MVNNNLSAKYDTKKENKVEHFYDVLEKLLSWKVIGMFMFVHYVCYIYYFAQFVEFDGNYQYVKKIYRYTEWNVMKSFAQFPNHKFWKQWDI